LEIKKTDKILILAPHADDESIGCGGLLLHYASQCDVICLTNCRTGNMSLTPQKAIKERESEFISAMESINVHSYYFNKLIDSDNLGQSYKYFADILSLYNLSKYEYLCIPIFYDQHQDHKAVSKLLQRYLTENNITIKAKILFYEVWSTVLLANKYIDLTGILPSKYNLIGFHKSQIKDIDYRERIQALNIYRGMIVNKQAAEVYFEITAKEFKEMKI